MSPMQIGAEVAKRSLPDLNKMPSPHLTVYASHDAFWNRDDIGNTIAAQMKTGIDSVLGAEAAFILAPVEMELALPIAEQWKAVKARQHDRQPRTIMTIVRASNDRVGGWNLIQDLLRWKSILPERKQVDERYALKLRSEHGERIEVEYRLSCEEQPEEVLPRLRFTEDCPATLRSLRSLVHNEGEKKGDNPEDAKKMLGDDEADAARYLIAEFPFQEGRVPRVTEILTRAKKHIQEGMSTEAKIQIMRHTEQAYDKEHRANKGFTLTRKSGRRARIGRQALLRQRSQVHEGAELR